MHQYGCTTVINIAVLNIINDLGKVNRPLPVLYTLAGKCILKAPKRASYYYGVLNTMGNVLFYIIVICQPAKYKQGKDSQGFILYIYYSDHTVKSYNTCSNSNTAEKRLRMHQIMKIWRGI